MMRRGIAVCAMVVVAGWIMAPGQRTAALCVGPGQSPPELAAETLEGKPVTLEDYRGKVVFLAFWASWCSRCREEIDFLKRLSARFSGDVVVLAINQEAEELLKTHLKHAHAPTSETQIPFPVLLDPNLTDLGGLLHQRSAH